MIYEDSNKFINSLPINDKTSINWIANSESKIYELNLFNKNYHFKQLNEWVSHYSKLIDNDYFIDFTFVDTIKIKGSVRALLPEEFFIDEAKILKEISFAKLSINPKAESVFVIKDMQISKFPHNLFLDSNGDFIHKKLPITNVLSTEWLLNTNRSFFLKSNFTKSIWIPIESGDIPLNYLYSNIESTLNEKLFDVYKNVTLGKPLSADINIICSHGAKNISETQIIFQDNNPTYDLNSVIGKGKILVFFVCYSGSMKTEFFRNNVASMVKKYISMGYEAVIAPYWALDVTIPRYWLPEFLNSLENKFTISEAVFKANRKVYERYPTPAAWACLHLYGNPNIIIENI